MQRRTLIAAALSAPLAARAHHGWSSFDQGRPIWLEGRAIRVAWRNPHAELVLDLPEFDGAFVDSHELGRSYGTARALLCLDGLAER